MKRMFILLLSAVFCFVSCYNDAELKESVSDLENRVVTLEKLCKEMNTNLTSLQAIVNAMNENDFVTGVKEVENGYTISFTKSKPITIYNGKNGNDGADGNDGKTPAISIKNDADGNYYWTLDGEYILVEGKKIQANGSKGEEGAAPQLKIENGKWLMKVGEEDWKEIGQATGDAFFKDIQVGENDLTIVLADGQTFVIPMKAKLAIEFTVSEKPAAGQTIAVPFKVTGISGLAEVKAIGQNGWSAKVVLKTYTEGEIMITAPDPLTDDEIIVLVSDGEGQTIMSSISWKEEQVLITAVKEIKLKAEPGQFNIELATNMEYTVEFTGNEGNWLAQVESRAMRTEEIVVAYAENKGVARNATMDFKDKEGKVVVSLPISQESYPAELKLDHTKAKITSVAGEYVLPGRILNLPELKITSSESWATASIKNGDLVLAVEENKTGAARTVEISLEGEALGKKLTAKMSITQIEVSAVADIVNVSFADDGTAYDFSASKRTIYTFPGSEVTTQKLDEFGINAAIFSHGYNKTPSKADGTYTIKESEMRPAMENGYTLEAYIMCAVEPVGMGKESKAFSSTASGGTAIMLHGTRKDITFLLCGDVEPADKKVWRFIETGIIPEPGKWYHVIGTWDKATGTARVYVNGEKVKEVINQNDSAGVPANMKIHWSVLNENAYFTIGANSVRGNAEDPSMNNSWEGGVAAARIYSGALAPEQIPATQINLYKNNIQLYD